MLIDKNIYSENTSILIFHSISFCSNYLLCPQNQSPRTYFWWIQFSTCRG